MTTNEKIQKLRQSMKANGVYAYLIPSSDPHMSEYLPDHWTTRAYFSGFDGSAGTLVVTEDKSGLWTDGRYFLQAGQQLAGSEVQLYKMGMPGVPTVSEFLEQELVGGKVLGIDGTVTATSTVRELQAHGVSVKAVDCTSENWEGRPAIPATEVYVHEVKYTGLTAAQKLVQLKEKLQGAGANTMVITRLDSIAWLLNLRANDIAYNPFLLSYVLVEPEKTTLFVNTSRVCTKAKESLAENGVELREYEEILPAIRGMTGEKQVLVDPASVNYAVWQALEENSSLTLIEGAEPVQALKSIKNETEIENIKNAHVRDGVAMVRFQRELERRMAQKIPTTECDIEVILRDLRAQQPLNKGESFSTIAGYGENGAIVHYHALPETCATVQAKGLLLVDSGAQYLDGTTDITRTYAMGELTREEKEYYTTVLKTHISVARTIFLDGTSGSTLDMMARSKVWSKGIDYRHGTGHGVGYFGGVHEGPHNLRTTSTVPFHAGMLITDEPGYYEEGKVGIRIENILLVKKLFENEYGTFLGYEPVTYCPIDTTPVLVEQLDDEEIAWLNEYHRTVYEKLAGYLEEDERAWLKEKTAPISKK
ncbi:MAG TPA: aminopeptidase P family protein [Firmicutes bacterium]|nr:aminopeptidase P family protein [Bacillota bacterium]